MEIHSQRWGTGMPHFGEFVGDNFAEIRLILGFKTSSVDGDSSSTLKIDQSQYCNGIQYLSIMYCSIHNVNYA
jgi:hypothetical protein